jgi:hypothetical protein
MNSIRNFSNFFKNTINVNNPITYVGRWSVVEYNDQHINQIIDRNNEDHCGTCNYSVNELIITEQQNIVQTKKEEEYYLFFCM